MNYKISYVLTRQICPRSLSYNSPKTSRRIDKEKNLTKNSFPAYGSNPLHDCQILVKQSSLIEKKKKKRRKKWELFQTRKRWRRHDLLSILRDTISTIYPIMERNPDLCPLRLIHVSLLRFISTGNDIISRDKDL